MKIKYFQAILVGFIAIPFISFLLIAVPASQAQSSKIWTDPINLSNAGSSINPTLVIDTAGTIHVIWFDQFDGYNYTKSTDGANWTAPKTMRFPFSPVSPVSPESDSQPEVPVLLADESGRVHALWREKNNALYYSMVSVSSDLDLTSSWTTRKKLADSVVDFEAVISSQGILHVGYVSSLNTLFNNPVGVFYRHLIGNSWSIPNNLYFSQYFRSLKPEESNVSLAVSEANELETVYMVWDDRPQKQILLSKSLDGGNLWESAVQIRGSVDSSGIPYNINVGAYDNNVLLLWQSGVPGSQCTQYSQWSIDGAEQFDPPVKMLDELAGCSQVSEFMLLNKDLSVVLLNSPESISLAAWNGTRWSKPQVQNEIAAFVNPATLDNVIFGCQKVSIHEGQLFVVGCDKGNGGDIWFSSRSLETVEDWFPSLLKWAAPVDVTNVDQQISALSSVADGENNIHTFWVQIPSLERDVGETTIQYVGWNGQSWSSPATIISELDGTPMQLAVKADSQKRILLTWIDSKKGNLFFTSAESNRTSTASGWETPQFLPSVSQVNRSPDILVDDSGKIIVAYAIPINEQRGIYFVQSDDGGTHWTQPFQIFDAAAAGWDIVDQPDISLTADGRLHVMFKRYSFQGEPRQSLGLYYTYSENGGVTWIDPETVSEHPVPWSEIIRYDRQILHRLWQEYNQSMLISFHQISQDGGTTWSSPVIVSSISANTSLATQTMDRAGNLHFLQLTGKDNLTILSHMWNGSSWISQEPKELYIKDRGIPSSITAGVSSNGDLLVSVLVDYPYLTSELKRGILSLGKSLELPEEMQTPYPAIIAVAEPTSGVTEDMSNILQSTAQTLPVTDLNDLPSSSSSNKNLVGILLLGGIIVLISIIFMSIFRKHDNPKKTSK